MSRVKKGKKKGSKKKKTEEVTKDELTEVDREIFQITITDLTQKYERIKARCLELEALNDDVQKNYEKLDEDRADIIAYLNRTVQHKMDEIDEIKERLEGLRQAKEADGIKCRERISQLEHEYKVMHEQLTSEIKLLSGKLNSLEEFRTQRDDLMKKFKDQELQMEDQEDRHKREIYEIERKFILGKDKLKREMEDRLVQLSQDFQETTQLRMAATTHRTIRENIALNNELDLMLETAQKLTAQNTEIKNQDTQLRLTLQLYEQEKDAVIAKNRVQQNIIEKIAREHEEMEAMVGRLVEKANRSQCLEVKLKNSHGEILKLKHLISTLQQNLDASNYEQTVLLKNTIEAEDETRRLQRIIYQTVVSVKNALDVKKGPSLDEAVDVGRRSSLLNNMLILLNMAHLPPIEILMKDSDQADDELYCTGDLGLIAKHASIYTVGSGFGSDYSGLKTSSTMSVMSATQSGGELALTKSTDATTSKQSITSGRGAASSKTEAIPATSLELIKELSTENDFDRDNVEEQGK